LEDIRQATNKGGALGNEQFFADIESFTGRRVIERKRVRPVGWRKKKRSQSFKLTLTFSFLM
jgi:putative transposase